MEDILLNLPNVVPLSDVAWTLGSLSLMVSYGACFAFIIYFIMTSLQLAPRYKLVAILSAVVMASAGLSLMREWSMWAAVYDFSTATGMYEPVTDGQTFSNAYRYGNWTITVPLLLIQLPLALGLARKELHSRSLRMIIAGVAMIWTGLVGQFGEVNDFALLNIWGIISTAFFVWLLIEIYGVIRSGKTVTPPSLIKWPGNFFWFMLATWGLYPIAYALPQLGQTQEIVVAQQFLFTLADISTKLIYGVILSRFCLRKSALEGYPAAVAAMDETGITSHMSDDIK
ncbi:bacteriorhodopsin-like [Hellea sp.]|nr:bacteriorhodopsin-like [Hellea sp.]